MSEAVIRHLKQVCFKGTFFLYHVLHEIHVSGCRCFPIIITLALEKTTVLSSQTTGSQWRRWIELKGLRLS